ncbi:hypothetical protein BVY03_05775, partial [bacterium K02(2017)]
TLACFIAVMSGAFFILTNHMKVNLFPYDDIDVFYVVAEMPDGTSLHETSKQMKEVEAILNEIPRSAMVNFTTVIGHHDRDVYGATAGLRHNWAMSTIFLKPAAERDIFSETIMSDLEVKLKSVKGFKSLKLDKFNDGPPIGRPITLSIIGTHDKTRQKIAKDIYNYLSEVKEQERLPKLCDPLKVASTSKAALL